METIRSDKMTQKINAKYKCNGKCKYAARQIQQRCNTEARQRRNVEMEKNTRHGNTTNRQIRQIGQK